ncbi:hypothetical protein Q9295_07300 [Xinfangfangia sp. CPCC 101601]|uniref:Porin n=1 Tax=Pseudogemmobacter lacusdianii TaxID=3069608 RepID=A0ABU0VWN6_9RHOB|nr:hypothetical protein [Xinfangfangia sp. CPCC 101601]MDQ2066172.1 hypothetical protein [Xinfangfangia sp. CPCC 101601]
MRSQKTRFGLSLSLVTGLLAASPTLAQEMTLYGGLELEHLTEGDWDAQTEVSGYLELEYGGAYVGATAHGLDVDGEDYFDVYVGYRGESGQLSYTGYATYYINTDSVANWDDYVELGVEFDYAVNDAFSLGADFYYEPKNSHSSHYLSAAYTISDSFSTDISIGRYEDGAGGWSKEWELGGTYYIGDETSIDLRYYEGEDYGGYFGLSLAWDTTIFTR